MAREPSRGDAAREFHAAYGEAVPVAKGVARVTVNNPSRFTFHGTNTYIVGTETLAIVDPGPDDEDHLRLLLTLIGGRPVSHIFVTHTHRDHSPLASRLKEATGALTVAEGPGRAASRFDADAQRILGASNDLDFVPDLRLADGGIVEGDGWSMEVIHTPGHAANHAAFALIGTDILFSGDHVMGWSTTIVAPPDGSMGDYMASLDKLLEREDGVYLPGHGGAIVQSRDYVRQLRAHRKMRETAILTRIRGGDRTVAELVRALYSQTDPALHGAAGLTVLAHLEYLIEQGLLRTEGKPRIDGIYEPA